MTLGQAAGDAVFERTVDMVTVMATEADLRDRLRVRIEAVVDGDTQVLVARSLGLVDNGHRAHAPEPYLDAAVTGAVIAQALGATR